MTARISSARVVTYGPLPLLLCAAVFALLLLASGAVHGATLVVNSAIDEADSNPGDGLCEGAVTAANCSLRAAVEEANALAGDDLITLPSGTYTLTMGQIMVSGPDELTITGAGRDNTVIDGNGVERVIVVVEFAVAEVTNLRLSRLTIRNGDSGAGEGGGILSQGAVTLDDSVVEGNRSGHGGGIYNVAGRLTLSNTLVLNNAATGDGGGIYNAAGSLTVTGGAIGFNSAAFGGGIWSSGDATLEFCTIGPDNVSGGAFGAGGIANRGILTLTGSTWRTTSATRTPEASGTAAAAP